MLDASNYAASSPMLCFNSETEYTFGNRGGELMKEKAYEEIGPNYRFFLAWRHAAFAGGLVILWGTCSLLISAYEKGVAIAWLIPLPASLALFSLWLADCRTRQIYRSLTLAGKALEDNNSGPYHALTDVGIQKDAPWFPKKGKPHSKLFSQSFALDCFFVGSALGLLVVAFFAFDRPPSVENQPQLKAEPCAPGMGQKRPATELAR